MFWKKCELRKNFKDITDILWNMLFQFVFDGQHHCKKYCFNFPHNSYAKYLTHSALSRVNSPQRLVLKILQFIVNEQQKLLVLPPSKNKPSLHSDYIWLSSKLSWNGTWIGFRVPILIPWNICLGVTPPIKLISSPTFSSRITCNHLITM